MSISVKSGGDRFSGSWYSDYESDATISDNVPDYLRSANTRDDNGYFVRTALERGNPIDRQYDVNWNVGGPIWKQKAWFFTSWRLNDQYKFSLGSDLIERSKLSNKYTLKGTFQLPQQAREAAGDARPRTQHAALGRPVSGLAQLSVEGRVDQRARQPRVPRCDLRELVQLLSAPADERLRPL